MVQNKLTVLGIFLSISAAIFGQHYHKEMMDTVMKHDHETMEMAMNHAYSRNLPMNRNASGTSWLPDSSVMYGHGKHLKEWMIMFHANIFVRYNNQDITNQGSRGGEKFDVPNWFMLMGQRKVGKRGLFCFGTMFSFDPFTVGGEGISIAFSVWRNS
jgi:hypothetical protein